MRCDSGRVISTLPDGQAYELLKTGDKAMLLTRIQEHMRHHDGGLSFQFDSEGNQAGVLLL